MVAKEHFETQERKPTISEHSIIASDGARYNVLWDETNNTLHFIEYSMRGSPMRMVDFESVRSVRLSQ